jgi:hypothetical protein
MSWINGNGFVPSDALSGTRAGWDVRGGTANGPFPAGSPGNAPLSSDGFRPAWFGRLSGAANEPSGASGLGAILARLAGQVQAYIGKLGMALLGAQPAAPSTPATAFSNVSLASTGDPHLSVSGTQQNADGTSSNVDKHFDSMAAHADLFSTRDFRDGFNVSTTVTQPSANGITQNASATASMEGGRESVTLGSDGALSVLDHGQSIALTAGASVTLSGGQRVSEAANGAVSIAESSFGANLTATFTPNGGGGVDVTATGQNVTLSGDLIAGRA